jgi:hypothetical protein
MPITALPSPVQFCGKKPEPSRKRQPEGEILDCIVVAKPPRKLQRTGSDGDELLVQRQIQSELESALKKGENQNPIDPEPHLRATIPPLGSYNPNVYPPLGRRLSPGEFLRMVFQHNPNVTFGLLEELVERGPGARRAVRELHEKATDKPNRKIGKPSARHLQSGGLMSRDGTISPDILKDVRDMVQVDDFSDKITLTFPKKRLDSLG